MLKRIRKRVPLTAREPLKVNQIVLQREFVFRLEITSVERGIVRGETIRHVGVVEAADGLAHRLEIGERAGLQIGAGTQLKTDAPPTEVR